MQPTTSGSHRATDMSAVRGSGRVLASCGARERLQPGTEVIDSKCFTKAKAQ